METREYQGKPVETYEIPWKPIESWNSLETQTAMETYGNLRKSDKNVQ